jgi:hypothetical protein
MALQSDVFKRAEAWVACASRWTENDHPLVHLNKQMLGHAERPILAMEATLAQRPQTMTDIQRSVLLTECSALSIYWLFGLYETLRTLRQRVPDKFEPLAEIFCQLEIARMPLAKHEVKSAPSFRNVEHYPTSLWDPTNGRVGWHVFDPLKGAMVTVARTNIADRFLAVEMDIGER